MIQSQTLLLKEATARKRQEMQQAKLSVTYFNVDDLIPYARNARTHSDSQIEKIVGSIKEFGFVNPVLIDENKSIVAGHGRIMAAKKMGMQQVPVVQISELSEQQIKAFRLAENRISEYSGWDRDILEIELKELKLDFDFDISLTGFEMPELDDNSSVLDEPVVSHSPNKVISGFVEKNTTSESPKEGVYESKEDVKEGEKRVEVEELSPFKPNVNPVVGFDQEVTQEDIQRSETSHEDRFKQDNRVYNNIICPACGHNIVTN